MRSTGSASRCRFRPRPNEVDPAIPFAEDHQHASYDPDAAHLFWRQLVQADRVMHEFRSHFIGKVSPVHFFWGAMDLACTRFSGRTAPKHPGGAPNCGDWVMVEGYSHELSSCGFWPGGGDEGAFYAYAYPGTGRFRRLPGRSDGAFYSKEHGQFLLPYEAVRTAEDPGPHPAGVSTHHLSGGRRTRPVGPRRTRSRSAPVGRKALNTNRLRHS